VAYENGVKPDGPMNFTFRCPSDLLSWKRRWPLLKKLILDQEPDVIGLQELDLARECSFSSSKPGGLLRPGAAQGLVGHGKDVLRDLEEAGFDGVFARKKGPATDGVGLFWRRSRLQGYGSSMTWTLAGSVHVAVAQRLRLLPASGGDADMCFMAVCTHFKAGLTPEIENFRARQADALMRCLSSHRDVLLMADLNAHPRSFTAPPPPGKEEVVTVEPKTYQMLTKSFRSAYAEVLQKESDFTCWGGLADKECRGTFDYVLMRGSMFEPRRVLLMPPVEEVLRIPDRLPNADYPSDHFLLSADISISATPAVAAATPSSVPEEEWTVVKRQRTD